MSYPAPKQFVIATVRVVGFHHWPDAPVQVAYLAARHRHEFVIKVTAEVGHANRDIEFHQLQRLIHTTLQHRFDYNGKPERYEFGAKSCEQICIDLNEGLFDINVIASSIEVWEDSENGARIEPVLT